MYQKKLITANFSLHNYGVYMKS